MPTPPKKLLKAIKKFLAWSYSRLNDWRKCPAYANYKHNLKMPEPGSDAMTRGTAIHKLAEKWSKNRKPGTAKTPPELSCFVKEFKAVQKLKNISTEQQWAFDKDWTPCDWFDMTNCRLRVVVDLCWIDLKRNILVLVDHKTGKINPDHEGQLSLYAVAGMAQHPTVKGVEVQLWYLDHGVIVPEEQKIYLRAEEKALRAEWEKAAKPMLADTRFAPKPSNSCRWCAYSKSKNGPCKF